MLPIVRNLIAAGESVDFNTATNEELASAYSEILPSKAEELMGFRKKLERINSNLAKTPNMGWSQFGSLIGREFQESLYKSEM
jgi:DNA uptake protein ComE-like DNA-binding protein